MAIPSYTTDLIDIDLCESGGKTWAEPTATGWTYGATPALDSENMIQGSSAISKAFNATGVGGMMVNNTAGITLPTDGAFLGWFYWASPSTLETDANGGLRFMVGGSLSAFLSWDVGGRTTYVYGGWINYAINTTITPDDTVSTGLGNSQYVGMAFYNTNAITKGSPGLCDAFRYGRCESRISGGESSNYATFAGYAIYNDGSSARLGLIQYVNGSYLVKGLIIFGYGSVVDFRDSNRALFIQNTNKVTANFNAFEVRQTGSRIDLTSITITSLGTISRGRWITTDNADVNINSCVFTDMSTFGFASNSTILNSTFRRCDVITQNGATFTGCIIDSSRGTKAMIVDNISVVTGTVFTSSGTGYAIEGFNTSGDYTISNVTFTGYAGSNGSTGNEAIHVLAVSGVVNINIDGGTTPSIHTAGATVNVIIPEVILTLTGLQTGSDISVLTAGTTTERVNIQENSGTTYLYNYTYAVNDYVDIGVFKAGYVPFYIRSYLLGNTNSSLPISQIIDRAYLE